MIMDNPNCYRNKTTPIQWGPILAGAIVGLGLSFLLNLYSMAIGLSAYTNPEHGPAVIAIGGVLGLLIGVIFSMGLAGYVAGYLARFNHCYCHGGIIYGFVTWSLAIMFSALLIMPLTQYVSFFEDNLDPHLTPPTATAAATTDVNVSVNSDSNASDKKAIETNPKQLAYNGWVLFGIFFMGALSSCIGACVGMRGCKDDEVHTTTTTTL